jgi:beta-xylosidase
VVVSRDKPQNPILAQNLPDPAIVKVDGGKAAGYYMVGTAGSPGDRKRDAVFTIQQSGDLTGWKAVGAVFAPGRWPTWAKRDFWAPEIHQVGNKFVVYYTARDHSGRLSIGAAWAKDVRGPYTDLGRPLIRDHRTGVIDSNFFKDDKGRPYLVWKLDGNDVNKPTPIYVQRLSPDGMKLEGSRQKLITNDQKWEGPLVEAPWVVKRGEYYYMFYSGNMYNTDRYATGVARSRSPFGPYEKQPEPVLRSNGHWAGPGHGAIIQKDGKDFYVYHAWKADKIGDPNPRMVLMDQIDWDGGWPKIGDGTPSGGVPAAPSGAAAGAAVSSAGF